MNETRSRALRHGALLLSAAFGAIAAHAAAAPALTGTPRITLPQVPMILIRELHRALPDGSEINIRHRYRIEIVAESGGYHIDGTLVDVAVSVPPRLEALAMVERQRAGTGPFPLRLDAAGRIVPPPAAAATTAPAPIDLRAGHAADMLVARTVPRDTIPQATAFIDQLRARAPAVAQWPLDLFLPLPGERRQVSALALPDGSAGTVTVITLARTEPGGLLQSLERRVVTATGRTSSESREIWTLTPARP